MQDLKAQRAVESDSSWHFVGAQCDCADPLDHGQLSRFISRMLSRVRAPRHSRRRFPLNFGNDYRYPRTSPRYGNFQLVCSRDYIMPSPVVVGRAIWKLATTEYGHVLITLGRLLGAMLFSAVAG